MENKMTFGILDQLLSGIFAGAAFLILYLGLDISVIVSAISGLMAHGASLLGFRFFDKNAKIERENKKKLKNINSIINSKINIFIKNIVDELTDKLSKKIIDTYQQISVKENSYPLLLNFDLHLDSAIKVEEKYKIIFKNKSLTNRKELMEKTQQMFKQLEKIFDNIIGSIESEEIDTIGSELQAIQEIMNLEINSGGEY